MDLAENMPDLKLCCEFLVFCVLHVFPHELTQQSFQHFATTFLKRYELLSPFTFAFDIGGGRWVAVPVPFSLIDEPVVDLL